MTPCTATLGNLGGLICANTRPHAGHGHGCSFEASWAADGVHDDVTDEED